MPNIGTVWTPKERQTYIDGFVKINQKPLDLDKWQEMFIGYNYIFTALIKSRRTGFSFATALKGLVLAQDPNRIKYVKQFVSYNEEDAKGKIRYAKEMYEGIPTSRRKKLVSATQTQLEFLDTDGKTTSRLISLACRPPRGNGGDLSLDEFGIYGAKLSHEIYTAALPVISQGGHIEIGSTPLGKLGRFYDVITDRKKYGKYKRLQVPWWISSFLCTNVSEAMKLAPYMETEDRVELFGTEIMKAIYMSFTLEDFQQEYECKFIDSGESYISLDLLNANTPGQREGERDRKNEGDEEDLEIKVYTTEDDLLLGYEPEKHGILYGGYDVARRRDAAVVFIIGLMPDGKKKNVAVIEMINKPFEYQREVIRKILNSLPVMRFCIDQTGQGEDTTENLQTKYGTDKIEGIIFDNAIKEVLATSIRYGLEQEQFLLHNCQRFRRQCHSIKRIETTAGRFRYDGERNSEDKHQDSFWAWALANHAAINMSAEKRENFYSQYSKNKQSVVNYDNGKQHPSITKKGKSLAAVQRSMKVDFKGYK